MSCTIAESQKVNSEWYMSNARKGMEKNLSSTCFMVHDFCAVFMAPQTERFNAQNTFTASRDAVATTYSLNPKSYTLLTM